MMRQRHSQRGASLIFALITLVTMMLAAIALVRSVDSGSRILGNIGFQQDATASADRAAREATNNLVQWKTDNVDLTVNNTDNGFYASSPANLDVTGQAGSPSSHTLVDWDGTCAAQSAAACLAPRQASSTGMTSGMVAHYVIFRLCQNTGALNASNCAQPLTSSGGKSSHKGACMAGDCAIPGKASGQYFRIVVRVKGARETISFTETIVQY